MLKTIAGRPFDFSNPSKFITTSRILESPVCFINGKWVTPGKSGSDTETITVEDPCTKEVVGEVPSCNPEVTEAAIQAAQEAFHSWRKVMPAERAKILDRWAKLMMDNKEALANILSRESGKIISEGQGEVDYAKCFVEWYAGEAERIYGDIIEGPRPGVRTTVVKQPVGVVGIITPWNFPAAMITRSAAGALAAGCTVVLRPSSHTPFTALALAQAAEEAGVPPGVFNVVTGKSSTIGKAFADSFDVRKLAFTGSTKVGKELFRDSADTMKKLALELGGNAPFIVFDDADLSRALEGLMAGKFRNAGQTCICCNRIFVQSSVYDRFKSMVIERVSAMKVGSNFDTKSSIGAMIDKDAVEHMQEVVKDAVDKGAKVEVGGSVPKDMGAKGFFFLPTVLSNVNHDTMKCCQDEIFGPIIPLVPFQTEEEVVALANSTKVGLAAYFYTNDYRRQYRVSEALQFGMVGVNDTAVSSPCAPFGGVKESGIGTSGSKYGIDPFLDIKHVMFSLA